MKYLCAVIMDYCDLKTVCYRLSCHQMT